MQAGTYLRAIFLPSPSLVEQQQCFYLILTGWLYCCCCSPLRRAPVGQGTKLVPDKVELGQRRQIAHPVRDLLEHIARQGQRLKRPEMLPDGAGNLLKPKTHQSEIHDLEVGGVSCRRDNQLDVRKKEKKRSSNVERFFYALKPLLALVLGPL